MTKTAIWIVIAIVIVIVFFRSIPNLQALLSGVFTNVGNQAGKGAGDAIAGLTQAALDAIGAAVKGAKDAISNGIDNVLGTPEFEAPGLAKYFREPNTTDFFDYVYDPSTGGQRAFSAPTPDQAALIRASFQ